MATTHKKILKMLLLSVALLLGMELLLQLGALIVAATSRNIPTGWSTENTRVLALGDSNTFGLYLNEEESYPSQLEELWNVRHPNNPIEVLNLGYPGTNSFRIADNLEGVINTFKPEVVLLTIGVNDKFTASEFVEADPDAGADTVVWEPLTLLRRYSRLYKLVYMTRQGARATDNDMAESTNVPVTKPLEATVNKRDTLTWSDDPKERMENIVDFKMANSEAVGTVTGLTEVITYGDKKIVMVSDKENSNVPGKEKGLHHLEHNLANIEQKLERNGVELYLLTYAASASFYTPTNAQIRNYMTNNDRVRFVDVAMEFKKDCPISADCSNLFFQDFHPKAKGYRKVASIIADAFEQDAKFSE